MMRHKKFMGTLFMWLLTLSVFADSGTYICGHFRRDRTNTVPALKASGFTFGILFNVHIDESGNLLTDGEMICKDGEYVFKNTSPNYVDDVNALLTGLTSILRLEYCIGGAGNTAYENVTKLSNKPASEGGGFGPTSILYRNFKALKEAIPAVIAINNDIEQGYNASPQAQFHIMLYDLGFKTTMAPYRDKNYWNTFASTINTARPGAVDRNYLQCYDGGAYNNPKDWVIEGLKPYGSFNVEGGYVNNWKPYSKITDKLKSWKSDAGIIGGFYWNYNETRDLQGEAKAVNDVFGSGTIAYRDQRVARAYPVKDYKSPQVDFSMGSYTSAQIAAKGIDAKNVKAFQLLPGVKMVLYTGTDLTGDSFTITESTPDLSKVTTQTINSWKVMANNNEKLNNRTFFIKNKNSGYYMKPSQNKDQNALTIQQREMDDTDYSKWRLELVKDNLYKIVNAGSGKVMTVKNSNIYDAVTIEQNTYDGSEKQHFLVIYNETDKAYKLVALHSLKGVGLADNRLTSKNGTLTQLRSTTSVSLNWELIDSNGTALEQIEEKTLRIYPTETSDKITIESEKAIAGIDVLDLKGARLMSLDGSTSDVDVSALPNGFYFLSVKIEGQLRNEVVKFIKK